MKTVFLQDSAFVLADNRWFENYNFTILPTQTRGFAPQTPEADEDGGRHSWMRWWFQAVSFEVPPIEGLAKGFAEGLGKG